MRFGPLTRLVYSEMSGELFELSVDKGYESRSFVDMALNTDYGRLIYNDIRANEWLADTFLMAGYERHFGSKIVRGKTFSKEVMQFCGYIYRYWAITEDRGITEIYNMAPLDWLKLKYPFYHTQGEEYVIHDIKDAYSRGITQEYRFRKGDIL